MEHVEEVVERTSAELKEQIRELKEYIDMLRDENRDLRAQVAEYQRREFLQVMQQE